MNAFVLGMLAAFSWDALRTRTLRIWIIGAVFLVFIASFFDTAVSYLWPLLILAATAGYYRFAPNIGYASLLLSTIGVALAFFWISDAIIIVPTLLVFCVLLLVAPPAFGFALNTGAVAFVAATHGTSSFWLGPAAYFALACVIGPIGATLRGETRMQVPKSTRSTWFVAAFMIAIVLVVSRIDPVNATFIAFSAGPFIEAITSKSD